MDAGARGRRLLQRKEYKEKVSEFVPKELEDHVVYEQNPNTNMFPAGTQDKVKKLLDKGTELFNKNKILRSIGNIFKSPRPGSNYTPGGKVPATNSFEPEGEMIEANSDQMKAMHDAKMKKMEDDKVAEKKKKKVDEACWKGYEKKGMKTMFGKRYPNCVKKTKKEEVEINNEGMDHSKKSPYDSSHPGGSVLGQVTKKARKLTLSKKKKDQKRGRDLDKIGTKLTLSKTSKIKPSMKEGVQSEAKKSCGEGEYYCHDDQKCKPIPDGMKVGKDGMLVKEDMKGMSQKSGDKRSTESGAGMTAKGVAKYNRRTGGNLKTAVTTPPSKLKPGSKAAKRRKSFCARSKSWTGPRGKAARRRWNCSYEPELPMIIDEKKKLFNTAPLSDRVSNWSKKINEGSPLTPGRNEFGLPTGLKSGTKKNIEKKVNPKNLPVAMASYEPQGEMIERKMTSSEKDKKEKYVKGMKKDKGGFTKRYGKDGKSVMYATATKMAMKKESYGDVPFRDGRVKKYLGGQGKIDKLVNLTQKGKQAFAKIPDPKIFSGNKPINPDNTITNLYKTRDRLSMSSYEPQGEMIEAKYEKGASTYGKASIRNKRAYGYGGNAKPPAERGAAITRRKDEHMARRGVKKGNKYAPDKYKPTVYGRDEDNDKYRKNKNVSEGSLHSWFKGSKSKDGKPGWVNVVTGGTCASDKKGEGTPKCVSSSKRASMSKAERLSASRRKKKADPGQQSKSGAAKPTYVATDSKKKK